ncbi:MAG TPA: serine/threonine-protein kinase [Vicinamibacteria bacterium]
MQCPSCSAEFPEGANFCPGCATPRPSGTAATAADPLAAALQIAVGAQYEVGRLLGRGGMGAVFLAREPTLDRHVAIKVLPSERTARADRERFRREARTAARLTHPNIVPLHTFGDVDGTMYFVMGCVRGEPLAARMKRGIGTDAARQLLVELADALDHAHRQGVIHRDVKPANVLIDDDSGRAMLTDFGIAKAEGPAAGITTTGALVGTPAYMSPEQAAGKTDLDGRSDIYSLGVMGYEMLAGRLPFDSPSVGDLLVQHMTRHPAPLREVAPDVPDALAAVIMRCLEKDRALRWPDARSLRDALVSTDESGDMPEALRQIDGVGNLLLGVGFVLSIPYYVQWLWQGRFEHQIPPAAVPFLLGPLLVALILTPRALQARRAGQGWKTITGAMFLEPAWWRWWYPRALRRPEDHHVWERLPPRIRLTRLAALAAPMFGVMGIAVLLAFISPRFDGFKAYPHLRAVMMWPPVVNGVRAIPPIGLVTCLMGWTVLGALVSALDFAQYRALGRFGLSEMDRKTILHGALPRPSFWRKPVVAAILRPEDPEVPPAPRTPAELAAGIATVAGGASGLPAAILAEAVSAARRLIASIEDLDREIAQLGRDADPAERGRLHERLVALAEPVPDEPDERSRMRSLLQQQMRLMGALDARLSAAGERRGRRLEMLKALWLEVANLRADAAGRAPGRGGTTERVRDLCARIAGAYETAEVARDGGDDAPTLAR